MIKKYFWHICIDIIAIIISVWGLWLLYASYYPKSQNDEKPSAIIQGDVFFPVAPYNQGVGPLPSQPGIPQQ